jgi:hypothetical protein
MQEIFVADVAEGGTRPCNQAGCCLSVTGEVTPEDVVTPCDQVGCCYSFIGEVTPEDVVTPYDQVGCCYSFIGEAALGFKLQQ